MASRPKRTEDEMLRLLALRHNESGGNGDAWAFMTKVKNDAGHAATGTADAIAMSLWRSRGLRLHGFEVKCSRSDWLYELKHPEKAESFIRYVHHWWMVVADETI